MCAPNHLGEYLAIDVTSQQGIGWKSTIKLKPPGRHNPWVMTDLETHPLTWI